MGWINQHLNPSSCIAAIVLKIKHMCDAFPCRPFKSPPRDITGGHSAAALRSRFSFSSCVSSGETRLCPWTLRWWLSNNDSVVCRPSLCRASTYAHGCSRQCHCMQVCSCQLRCLNLGSGTVSCNTLLLGKLGRREMAFEYLAYQHLEKSGRHAMAFEYLV